MFPRSGRRQQTEAIRKHVARRYGYLIYYTVDEARQEVVVLSVRHPAQEPERDDG